MLTRRELIGRGAVLGLVVIGGAEALEGCGGGELLCTSATAEQMTQRTALGYVEKSPDPNKVCSKCNFWGGGTNVTACGNCTLNMGNVNPGGSCNSFSPKA